MAMSAARRMDQWRAENATRKRSPEFKARCVALSRTWGAWKAGGRDGRSNGYCDDAEAEEAAATAGGAAVVFGRTAG
jgi:hypothetical protein